MADFEPARGEGEMPRFLAVDGLRGWMAWAVVLGHIVQHSGQRDKGGLWHHVFNFGDWGVEVFIIISGFVITHLLLERQETYASFIVRRFARLFPVYAFCCVVGGAVYILSQRIGSPAWFSVFNEGYSSQISYLPWHLLAHLTMMHGAIPNSLLPMSEYVFLPPAWSVSLEWQFYLLAPFLVHLARRENGLPVLAAIVLVTMLFYDHWLASLWRQPSIILGTSQYFLIGIVSRLLVRRMHGTVTSPLSLAIIAFAFAIWLDCIGIAIWLTVYGIMMADRRRLLALERRFVALAHPLLESRPVQYLAQRSYSTYLVHWPVLMLLGALVSHRGVGPGPRLAAILLLGIPITATLQIATYRWIEQPCQRLGSRWARRLGEQPMREVAVS